MTAPQVFYDAANELLAQGPARIETGTMIAPGGDAKGVLTIRTASTTLTVILEPSDVQTWAGILTALGQALGAAPAPGGAGLSVASPLDARMLGLNGNRKN